MVVLLEIRVGLLAFVWLAHLLGSIKGLGIGLGVDDTGIGVATNHTAVKH